MIGPRKGTAKVGIFGLTGCAGDQLALLHDEDNLLALLGSANIVDWLMVESDNDTETHLDVAIIEGSVSTEQQAEHVKEIRERADTVIAIGHCACFGGPQAMAFGDGKFEERLREVYQNTPITLTKALEAQPIDKYIHVDFYVPGCPINPKQFASTYTRAINGLSPYRLDIPVCAECKWRNNGCLLLKGQPCFGPLTHAGCNASCPSYGIPCIGCWGPVDEANLKSFVKLMQKHGMSEEDVLRRAAIYLRSLVIKEGFVLPTVTGGS